MTLLEQVESRAIALNTEGELRVGQSLMLALHEINPLMYNAIRYIEFNDCFYDDSKIEGFKIEIDSDKFKWLR